MDSLLFHFYCSFRGVLIHLHQVYSDKVTILIVTRFVCNCDVTFFVLFIYRTCVLFPSNIKREESCFDFISSFIIALIRILPGTPAVGLHIPLVGNHCTRATRGLGVSANFPRVFRKVSSIVLESERVETRGFSYCMDMWNQLKLKSWVHVV